MIAKGPSLEDCSTFFCHHPLVDQFDHRVQIGLAAKVRPVQEAFTVVASFGRRIRVRLVKISSPKKTVDRRAGRLYFRFLRVWRCGYLTLSAHSDGWLEPSSSSSSPEQDRPLFRWRVLPGWWRNLLQMICGRQYPGWWLSMTKTSSKELKKRKTKKLKLLKR